MSPAAPIFVFPIFFAAIWVLVAKIVAVTGGWPKLAEKYATTSRGEGEFFRMGSARLGKKWFPASYNRCLIIAIGSRGIFMNPWLPFRFFHKPLFLPWRAVTKMEAGKFLWVPQAKITIEGFDGTVCLYGRAATAAQGAFAKYRAGAKADA